MIHTSRQLKDLVRNLSKETGIEAHVLIRKYIMERFLERTSLSKYREQFVLKGGLLVSAFVGTEVRATMDMDTTVRGLPVTEQDMTRIIEEICDIKLDDSITFKIKSVSAIMDEAEYSGLRFAMEAYLDASVTPLKIDISTGDVITPREILYSYKLMFEDRSISIMTYPIETVLAEKLETLISRSVTNTRMRDFYDIHVLLHSERQGINYTTLQKALSATSVKRESTELMKNAENVLVTLKESSLMQDLWKSYQRKYPYAADFSWDDVMWSARKLSSEAGLPVKKPSVLDMIHKPTAGYTPPARTSKQKDTPER
jgi:predicted nucleotidyltransferase component of viral defense system